MTPALSLSRLNEADRTLEYFIPASTNPNNGWLHGHIRLKTDTLQLPSIGMSHVMTGDVKDACLAAAKSG
jgi:hypothetical protein